MINKMRTACKNCAQSNVCKTFKESIKCYDNWKIDEWIDLLLEYHTVKKDSNGNKLKQISDIYTHQIIQVVKHFNLRHIQQKGNYNYEQTKEV